MTTPRLYVLTISHYCEKARWALDALGVDYDLCHPPVGEHIALARSLGLESSTMPIVVTGDEVVQGSSAIIDWADPKRRLDVDPELERERIALEAHLDSVVGVHLRRLYYAESLVDYSETVLRVFQHDLAPSERDALASRWEVIRSVMIDLLDLGAEQRAASRAIVEVELDRMDALLADGRRYLVGDHFSRVDVTAASLWAPAAGPAEHPTWSVVEIPPQTQADLEAWSKRPTLEWVRTMYRLHR